MAGGDGREDRAGVRDARAGARDARAGLAIFVKTPGVSPVKTRLAATLGTEATERFYRLAAGAVRGVALAAGDAVVPYWAVAEEEALGHPDWAGLPVLAQWDGQGDSAGEGGLGERMARVYAALLARHGRAILIGADAPQVTAEMLREAAQALDGAPHVIGLAEDGGFWLFGGRIPVPDAVWNGVAYSRGDTAARFLEALAPHGDAARVGTLADVDTAAEFSALLATLEASPGEWVAEQVVLRDWLRTLSGIGA